MSEELFIKFDKNSRAYQEMATNSLRRQMESEQRRQQNLQSAQQDVIRFSAQESESRQRLANIGSPSKWANTALNFAKGVVENTRKFAWTIPRGASVANQSRKMYELSTDAQYRAYQTDDEEERKKLLRKSEKYRLYAKTLMGSDAVQNLEDLGNLDLSTGAGRARVAGIAAGASLELGGFLPVGAAVKGAQTTSKLQRAVSLSLGLGDVADVAVDATRGAKFAKQAVVSGVAQAPIQGALETLITPEEDSLTDNIMYSATAGVALNLGFGFLGYTGGEAVKGVKGLKNNNPVVDFTDTVKAENINIPDDIDNVLEARNTIDTLAMLNGNVVGGKAFNLDVNDPRYIKIKENMIEPLVQTINAKKAREGVSIDALKGQRVRYTSQSGVELKGTVTDKGFELDSGKVLPMDEKLEKALVKGFDVDEQSIEKPSNKTIPPVLKPIENIINTYKTKEKFVSDYRKVVRSGGLKADETGEGFVQQFEVPDGDLTKTQKELRKFVTDLTPEKQEAIKELGVESPEEIYDLVKGLNIDRVGYDTVMVGKDDLLPEDVERLQTEVDKTSGDLAEVVARQKELQDAEVKTEFDERIQMLEQEISELQSMPKSRKKDVPSDSARVQYKDETFYLTGERKRQYESAEREYNRSLKYADQSFKNNPEMMNSYRKGAGMKFAAMKREILGVLTPKERQKAIDQFSKNFLGKEVFVDGQPGKVSSKPSFGKFMVDFDDGTARRVSAEEIVPQKSAEELYNQRYQSTEVIRAQDLPETEAKFQVEEGEVKKFQTQEPLISNEERKRPDVEVVRERGGERFQELTDEDINAIIDEAANIDNQGIELGELEVEVRKIMQQLEAEGFNLTPEQVSSTPNLNKLDEAIDQGVTPDPEITEQAHQEYIKNTGPRDEVDKTAGPQKESRFFKRVGEQRDLEGEPLQYSPAIEKEADAYADNLVETDLESARQIAMNQKSTGDAFYDIKIAQAYADKMAELGNMDEFTDAVRSISSISTQRGKGIAALRETKLLDPTTEVRKVVQNKKARVAKQLEVEVPVVKKQLTDIQVNKNMLSKILDDITCK